MSRTWIDLFYLVAAICLVLAINRLFVAERDEVIPVVHSKRLFDEWRAPKRWVELKDAVHNSTDDPPEFWQAIREFLVQPN